MKLLCINYGCYFGKFKSNDGLIDIDTTFGGQCGDGDQCCDKTSVQSIMKSFNDYASEQKCPSGGGGSNKNKLSGGAIAGIVIGIILFFVIVGGGGWYWR